MLYTFSVDANRKGAGTLVPVFRETGFAAIILIRQTKKPLGIGYDQQPEHSLATC